MVRVMSMNCGLLEESYVTESHELDRATCLWLLLTAQVGRLVVVDPKAVASVQYVVVGDALIVRIGADSAATGCPTASPVTLDVDAFDVFSQVGWSVHVRGDIESIGDVEVDGLHQAAGTHPPPWTAHPDGRWFRISPTYVSGHWFRPPERPRVFGPTGYL